MKIPLKSFYFVRHGETDWNREGRIMGHKDIELNQLGLDQAAAAGYVLVDMQLDIIYSSPLKRASETAEIIGQICEIDIELVEDLKEIALGEREGKFRSDPKNDQNSAGAESIHDFEKRVINAVSKILLSDNTYPLIVAHSGVFKVLAASLAQDSFIDCPNGKIFVFSPSPTEGTWSIDEV